jgi:hypothetical protein
MSCSLRVLRASLAVVLVFACAAAFAQPGVFDPSKKVMFEDDFNTGVSQWRLSIDGLTDAQRPTSSPRIVPLPWNGEQAVRLDLPGALGTYRTELALPWEDGLQERWYGQRVAIDRVPTDKQGFIVLQWHAILGADKPRWKRNFPNLAIALKDDRWVVRRAWGTKDNIQLSRTDLPGTVRAREWADWVVHVKWSRGNKGRVRAWLDGALVYDVTGPNSYAGIVPKTPYFKTGIYRPSRKDATTAEPSTTVFVAQTRIGRHDAGYGDVVPRTSPTLRGDYVINAAYAAPGQPLKQGGCLIVGNNGFAEIPTLFDWNRGTRQRCGFPDAASLRQNRQAVWSIEPVTSNAGQTVHVIRSRVNGKCLIRGNNGTAPFAILHLWPDAGDKQFCGLRSADFLVANGQAAWRFDLLEPVTSGEATSWFGPLRMRVPTTAYLAIADLPPTWPNTVTYESFNALVADQAAKPWLFELIPLGD